ncbi:T-complex protein 11-like protein 2 [Drosophila eugracilis]|uniref:T-complex protein 11-like protein 2 n=1 Tax=Drosophila eugracilis TaxID=29029 RepID=UPI0007E75281|nr:T-complex protein 11-like protein 2 [Drosophila eugracilis]XP_017064138.1 T-complex protein 11-like protein 2 [Drosophila eugracilis]
MDAQDKKSEQGGQPAGQSELDERRMRTDSESSVESMTRFVLPSLDGTPPKIVTLDEVSSMFKNLRNMELAHEIALNPDFKLQKYEPPSDSLEGAIKKMVHKAFWDILREQLERRPPSYDQAIRLLAEIRELFPQLLSPMQERVLTHINEVLDDSVIRQQAEQGTLDFRAYATFVINILARSCSPARDEAVEALRDCGDVVETFRSILEVMTLMKLDMANFMLALARAEIAANSVQYEKEKFSKYLKEFHGNAGFPATEDWLQRHRSGSNKDETIYNAYMQLIDYPADKEFPELLRIDKDRFEGLSWRAQRLILCASLISIAQSTPIISQRRENRIKLSQELDVIVQDVKNQDQVATAIESCYEQIRSFVNKALEQEKAPAMSDADQAALKTQVLNLANKASPVLSLMAKRLDGYVRVTLRSNGSIPPPPAGFADYQEELVAFIASFRRLVSYNHAVFGEHFHQILNKTMAGEETESTAATGSGVSAGQAQTAKP